MQGKSITFLKRLSGLSSATLATKVLGYARDAMLVAVFGSGTLTDAYYAAFRILNVFRRSVGEGSVNAGFIPALEKEKAGGHGKGVMFFRRSWTLVFFVSIIMALLGIIFSRTLIQITSHGFTARPEQFEMAVIVTAILMPHLVFVNVSALFTAALNAAGRFFMPAMSSAAFSICIIIYLFFVNHHGNIHIPDNMKLLGLAATASLSGLVQVLLLVPLLKKESYELKFASPFQDASAKRALLMSAPAAITLAQDQISLFVNTIYASFLEPGSITAIYNAARIIQFPVSLFAAAAAAICLPELSRHKAANRHEDFGAELAAAFKTTALIIIPAALGLMILSLPIARALFEHGRFTYESSRMTASVLFYLSIGLAGFGVNKLAAAACYGAGDIKTPIKIVLLQTAFNVLLCSVLMRRMGAGGLALATSISSLAAAAMFIQALRTKAHFSPGPMQFYLKSLSAAAIMAGFCLIIKHLFHGRPEITVALAVPGAVIVYFTALRVMKLKERALITGGLF